jgi:hypothetical protein
MRAGKFFKRNGELVNATPDFLFVHGNPSRRIARPKLWWGCALLFRPRYALANLGHPSCSYFVLLEIQQFGDVAILYSEYRVETEMHGKRSISASRATEIFVRHGGQWTNPGWHTDAEK